MAMVGGGGSNGHIHLYVLGKDSNSLNCVSNRCWCCALAETSFLVPVSDTCAIPVKIVRESLGRQWLVS